MKVLIVTNVYVPSWEAAGSTNFVIEQIKAVHKYCSDVEYTLYTIKGFENKWDYLKTIPAIRKEVNSGKYDLVHIHYGLSGLFMLGAFSPKIPIVLTLHGGDIQPEQGHHVQVFLTKQILKKCNAAISLNERMKSIVQQYCKYTEIIPCSIETEFFKPKENKQENRSKEKTIIFPSSHYKTVKDYPLFQRTVKLLEDKYGYKIKEIELKNFTREQVRNVLQDADMMLLTSISEGSPGVVKEAMASNLPVVCTNVGDVAINLKGVANSGVSNEHDENELAAICDKSFKGELKGTFGRDKIFQLGLDDESISKKIYALYNRIIKE